MGPVTLKFSAPPNGETTHQTAKHFWRWKKVLEVLYHHAKLGGVQTSHTAIRAKNVEFLFVGLSVRPSCSWDVKFERMTLPRNRWNLEVVLISLDRGRFVVVHPRSTLPLGGATTRHQVENMVMHKQYTVKLTLKTTVCMLAVHDSY